MSIIIRDFKKCIIYAYKHDSILLIIVNSFNFSSYKLILLTIYLKIMLKAAIIILLTLKILMKMEDERL